MSFNHERHGVKHFANCLFKAEKKTFEKLDKSFFYTSHSIFVGVFSMIAVPAALYSVLSLNNVIYI